MAVTLGALAALVCIILGFIAGLVDDKLLFDPLTWFVAAIAFAVLGGPVVYQRKGPQ
jgi:hypothetical protein